ncbi:O-antigen ligase family protein, partial [Patescibacteria group bacterium]|nr:O-antigen ligase family protein [Patescibacteria group bacterium]
LIVELLSFWGQQVKLLNTTVFLLIILITFLVSLIKLEYGLFVLLAELFVGSKGYLFFLDIAGASISLRMGLFIVIMAIWFYQFLKTRQTNFFSLNNKFLYYYLVLFLFLLIGLINGLAHQDFNNVFFDVNGWLFFALVPVFFEVISSTSVMRKVLTVLLVAVSYLSLKTLAVFVIFSHQLLPLRALYKWIRDSGVGEITLAGENVYRIFFQSQIYVLAGFFIVFAILVIGGRKYLNLQDKRWLFIIALLTTSALIVSQSRSFWVGLIVALVFCLINCKVLLKTKFIILLRIAIYFVLILALEVVFLSLISGNFPGSLMEKRLEDPTEEAAGSSRIAQLSPLLSEIKNKPFLGAGFGQTVTYQSDDPRIRQQSPDGNYTTYAFEWGYLDIWLKIGLIGLLCYLILCGKIIQQSWQLLKSRDQSFVVIYGFLLGLFALMVTSIFSPYLNHPLGIGYLLLFSAMLFYFKNNYARE